jgi:hypothetical protein
MCKYVNSKELNLFGHLKYAKVRPCIANISHERCTPIVGIFYKIYVTGKVKNADRHLKKMNPETLVKVPESQVLFPCRVIRGWICLLIALKLL